MISGDTELNKKMTLQLHFPSHRQHSKWLSEHFMLRKTFSVVKIWKAKSERVWSIRTGSYFILSKEEVLAAWQGAGTSQLSLQGRPRDWGKPKEKPATLRSSLSELMRLWSLLLNQRTPDSDVLACLTSLVSCPNSRSSVRAQKSNSTLMVSGKMLGTTIPM